MEGTSFQYSSSLFVIFFYKSFTIKRKNCYIEKIYFPIISKLFEEQMKEKSLFLFSLESGLRVVDSRPTNMPVVQEKELWMGNLSELEDGSVAIIDYESTYEEANFTKYGRYIMEIIDWYLRKGRRSDIHMMYCTRQISIKSMPLSIRTEPSHLSGTPSGKWLDNIKEKIAGKPLWMRHLCILLPLTYKGRDKKQEIIKE